jgi:hypothetical protein
MSGHQITELLLVGQRLPMAAVTPCRSAERRMPINTHTHTRALHSRLDNRQVQSLTLLPSPLPRTLHMLKVQLVANYVFEFVCSGDRRVRPEVCTPLLHHLCPSLRAPQ